MNANQKKAPEKENLIHGCPDNKVVNLFSFTLKELHMQISYGGLSFSPKQNMEEFTVYKEILQDDD